MRTVKNYFQTLNIIQFSLMAGVIVFVVQIHVMDMVAKPTSLMVGDTDLVFLYFILGMVVVCLPLGQFLYHRILTKALVQKGLRAKFEKYQTASIARFGFFEAPALCSASMYLVTSAQLFLLISATILLLMILVRATKTKAIIELELDSQERAILENPDAVIS